MKKRELRKKDRYNEKELYSFIVKKETEFDNETFYVLESEHAVKHLLPKKYYKEYNFEVGDKIKCYVDKINCAGEIFLEPVHPFYKLGKVYDFKVLKAGTLKYKGIVEYGIFVLNKYKKECFIPLTRNKAAEILKAESVKLKLLRIKKGIFHLALK